MKTAQDWIGILKLTEPQDMASWITLIQNEAFKAGMTLAIEVADNWINNLAANSEGQNLAALIRDDIKASRDATTKPF